MSADTRSDPDFSLARGHTPCPVLTASGLPASPRKGGRARYPQGSREQSVQPGPRQVPSPPEDQHRLISWDLLRPLGCKTDLSSSHEVALPAPLRGWRPGSSLLWPVFLGTCLGSPAHPQASPSQGLRRSCPGPCPLEHPRCCRSDFLSGRERVRGIWNTNHSFVELLFTPETCCSTE